MGELSPVIEGLVKFRDGKKWKSRFASITRLSPVADSLTLQLWKDRKEWEKNLPPSKGSIALEEYIGWEAGFTLDKESLTLAIILKGSILSLALDSREALMRWQIRISGQFDDGRHYSAHLVQSKSKLSSVSGLVRIHVQNRRFSITAGVPPKLIHSWDLVDLRRFGVLEEARFVFEGGSRCGKGEGVHVLRMDNPEELKRSFEQASEGRLENKRKPISYKSSGLTSSPSVASNLTTSHHESLASDDSSSLMIMMNNGGDSHVNSSREEIFNSSDNAQRCRSRSINWSEGGSSSLNCASSSSCDTVSVALSEITSGGDSTSRSGGDSDHLVNRKHLLEKMGMLHSEGCSRNHPNQKTSGEFTPQWSMNNELRHNGSSHPSHLHHQQQRNKFHANSSFSMDRLSLSSHDSQSSSGGASDVFTAPYDTPRSILQNSKLLREGSLAPSTDFRSPPLTPKTQRRLMMIQNKQQSFCSCKMKRAYENYDIPRQLGRQESTASLYDVPKSVREQFPNYDIPKSGGAIPLPTKEPLCSSCSTQQDLYKIERVKLTGNGRMPVADMRRFGAVSGKPPKSPVYAVINKTNKKKGGRSNDYVNLQVGANPNYENLQPELPNYVEMNPHPIESSCDYDTINMKLRKFHDLLGEKPGPHHNYSNDIFNLCDIRDVEDKNFDNYGQEPSSVVKSSSTENILNNYANVSPSNDHASMTLPRGGYYEYLPPTEAVTMRRSSSVPCKGHRRERGSTGSSDSGFSAGSPGALAQKNREQEEIYVANESRENPDDDTRI